MNNIKKCQYCGKVFFDIGNEECPYCKKSLTKIDDIFSTLFGDNK